MVSEFAPVGTYYSRQPVSSEFSYVGINVLLSPSVHGPQASYLVSVFAPVALIIAVNQLQVSLVT